MTTKAKEPQINVEDLSLAATDAKTVRYNWSDHERGHDWEDYEVAECWKCRQEDGKTTIVRSDQSECPECGCDAIQESFDGPMMNYFYPLPCFQQDPWEAAEKLKNLPLTLVNMMRTDEEDHEWVLALTGGGMNLAWEIAEAFVALGYVPPTDIAEGLPNLAGKKLSPKNKVIIAACRRAFEVERDRQQRRVEKLNALEKEMRRASR